MVEDYQTANNVVESDLTNMLLKDLNELLNLHGKKIDDYDLPSLPPNIIDRGAVPRGTGKTFLYRTLMESLRSRGEIVLATASSGIAATLLPGGRTAHSRFKIPIDIQPSSICGIEKQKDLANLIRFAAAIIWDEAPMTNKNCLEALDRSLQDICSNNAPFGGKVLIMGGGGFRQVLPVVRKGTKAQMITACIVQSHLWNHTKILHLRQNMRSLHDQEFAEFLIRIGDGVEPTKPDDMVRLPLHIAIPLEGEHSIQVLIQHIFPNLELHGWDAPYMVQRAILTPTNDDVQKLNDMIIDQFPGEEHNLLSFDEVEGDNHNLYQQEFLKSIAQGSLPPHILKIKKGNMLDVEILTGSNTRKRAFLPRIKIKTSASDGLPFVLSRKQFPVRLSFAITINKSQGQTIPNVGIYLPRHVFSHGQLYVALSRGASQTTTRVLTREGKLKGEDGDYTKNVVYKQILLSHPQVFIKYIEKIAHMLIPILVTRHTKLILYKWGDRNPGNSETSHNCCSTKSILKQSISILQFFKSQERIDKRMYEELIQIFIREKENTSNKDFMFDISLKERR
ncbi:uncharacterized protein LOC127137192 [Lathyrus oleraceus]|uniref:uncharacterized protein LOC127137192 n=1 Tax=Pisum sativum TaxID=3888 RepID=UPI0021D2887A|nr:uncharacterized protein LOC127137192 [Pisum sativum]